MLRDWQEFFKKLPRDIQEELDSLAKHKTEDKKRITKEIHTIIETDTRITTDISEEVTIRQAWGYYLYHRFVEKEQQKKQPKIEQVIPISDKEKINKLLKNPNLIDEIVETVQLKSSVVGEEKSIKVIVLVVISIKCVNIEPTSMNLHPEDDSGIGKDFVIKAVHTIFPNIPWIHLETPSGKAIAYLKNPESEKDAIDMPSEGVLHVEDGAEEFINDPTFKVYLSSEKGLKTFRVTKNLKGKLLKVPKWVVFVSSCDTSTNEQLHRRLPSFGMDSSVKQTKAIIDKQGEDGEKLPQDILTKEQKESIQLVIDALMELEKVYVIIPKDIGGEIEKLFGDNPTLLARTLHKTFQDYVKMSATLHQFQRKESEKKAIVDGKKYKTITATKDDFEIAENAFKTLYKKFGEGLLPFNKRQWEIFEEFKNHKGYKLTVDEVRTWSCCSGMQYGTIRNDLLKIASYTIIKIERGNKNIMYFKYPIHIKKGNKDENQTN